jgi:hypothetical protein
MTISEQVKQVIEAEKPFFESQKSFADLQKFYMEMQTKGLVVKQSYNLPLVDTIGKSLYQSRNQNNK